MDTQTETQVTAEVELVRLKVEPLDPEAFAPFGQVVDEGSPAYPDIDGDPIIAMLFTNKQDALWNIVAYHDSYNQTFLPLVNDLVMCVTPMPTPSSSGERMVIDYAATRAFLVKPGQGVEVKRGVGHNAIPATPDGCRFVTVTRRLPPEMEAQLILSAKEVDNDIDEFDVPGNYIVNLPRQDGRAFYIEGLG